ncbi:hypothetical protein [Vibrio phage phiKT1024]|nr:hypothetical protein [Vibrio phage phiKT1024]
MSFRLVIECSKDIDKLSIDFSDGSSVVTHSDGTCTDSGEGSSENSIESENKDLQNGQNTSKRTQKSNRREEQFLDTDEEFGDVQEEVVEKPQIEERKGDVKVAPEIQNLSL